ncbi:MAG: NAD(P)-dependent oxidoreductase [bacterium]|nr:NAD(P)-dependent oxidoreductase [bacterium]
MSKIFITGASGCIGHYVIDRLREDLSNELHLLLRDPARLKISCRTDSNIHIHTGNMEHIEEHKDILSDMDYLIHIATDWSDSDYAELLNVEKTHKMFDFCSKSKKIIYFSTASILGKNNEPVKEAELYGTGYVRSKYLAYIKLQKSKHRDKVITLFPTLVFGGDADHPYSHISSGIVPNIKYLKLLRFFYMESAFHFMHSYDIATLVKYILNNDTAEKDIVLGNHFISGKEAIRKICDKFNIPVYFRVKISAGFLMLLAKLMKIYVDPWSRYCIENPFFQYKVVNPDFFGEDCKFPDLDSLLQDIVDNSAK